MCFDIFQFGFLVLSVSLCIFRFLFVGMCDCFFIKEGCFCVFCLKFEETCQRILKGFLGVCEEGFWYD
jgi:hypothetical protein